MENIRTTDSYIAVLKHRLAALTAERDRFRAEAICLSEELQGLQTLSERLSSERDNLRGVVEKMQRELRDVYKRQALHGTPEILQKLYGHILRTGAFVVMKE